MFSQLRIGYPSPHERKPQILERVVIARSAILLTPFAGDWNIQPEPLKKLVHSTFEQAGPTRDEIDTSAVIITREAARRDNAAQISEHFADQAAPCICLTTSATRDTRTR